VDCGDTGESRAAFAVVATLWHSYRAQERHGVSDASQGPGWWQASDGKWYPPENSPGGASAPAGSGAPGTSAYGNLADWQTRAIGILIDFGFIVAVWIVGLILSTIVGLVSSALGGLVFLLFYLIDSAAWLYMGYLVGLKGRSPGMAMMGLKCVSEETGEVIGGGMGVVRTIAHIVDSIICYVGWLFPLWDAKRQTIADKLIKTYVLSDQPKESFSIDLLKP
jgi:uncharacterized RDD family membrane protein YckC